MMTHTRRVKSSLASHTVLGEWTAPRWAHPRRFFNLKKWNCSGTIVLIVFVTNGMQKLYCYADESGQDTVGKLFLVSVVIIMRDDHERLERLLDQIEIRIGKRNPKWKSTHYKLKIKYLQEILQVKILRGNIFYRIYTESSDPIYYRLMIAASIEHAINVKMLGNPYRAMVYIDGLKKTEQREMTRMLRERGVQLKKCRGRTDESSSIIRLADAIAGFARDVHEGQRYTQKLYAPMREYGLLKEVSSA